MVRFIEVMSSNPIYPMLNCRSMSPQVEGKIVNTCGRKPTPNSRKNFALSRNAIEVGSVL